MKLFKITFFVGSQSREHIRRMGWTGRTFVFANTPEEALAGYKVNHHYGERLVVKKTTKAAARGEWNCICRACIACRASIMQEVRS